MTDAIATASPFAWRSRALGALAASSARSNAHTSAHPFDLLVIGGGIVGCGVARDAALRGLKVALVEKGDFASGTSSRSSRLVHGGVRYLEHGHLHLVFESSRERRRLLRLAPHLVRPLSFTWPVYEGARVAQWKLLAGLTLYDALALFRNVGNHRRLTRENRNMPSTTQVNGRLALRPCFVGARTGMAEAQALVADVLRIGAELTRELTVERLSADLAC